MSTPFAPLAGRGLKLRNRRASIHFGSFRPARGARIETRQAPCEHTDTGAFAPLAGRGLKHAMSDDQFAAYSLSPRSRGAD